MSCSPTRPNVRGSRRRNRANECSAVTTAPRASVTDAEPALIRAAPASDRHSAECCVRAAPMPTGVASVMTSRCVRPLGPALYWSCVVRLNTPVTLSAVMTMGAAAAAAEAGAEAAAAAPSLAFAAGAVGRRVMPRS